MPRTLKTEQQLDGYVTSVEIYVAAVEARLEEERHENEIIEST